MTYWNAISEAHQNRLARFAEAKGVSVETALRNIVGYLQSDNFQPSYMAQMVTGKRIEQVIDMIKEA